MKLHCPHCGVKGSADDSYSGRKVKCPKCQGLFEVKLDMALEPPDDPILPSSAFSSTLTEFPAPPGEIEAPIAVDDGLTVDDGFRDTATDEVLSHGEFEELADEVLTAPESELLSPGEQEEKIEGGDTSDEDFWSEQEEDLGEIEVADFIEESSLLDSADALSPEEEIASEFAEPIEVAESYQEGVPEDETPLVQETDEIELEPYGIDKEQCWQCGKIDSTGESFIAKDDRLYCRDCAPIEESEETADTNQEQDTESIASAQELNAADIDSDDGGTDRIYKKISIRDSLRTAWMKTKGAKSSIWAGSAIMYLVILVIVFGSALLLRSMYGDLANLTGLVGKIPLLVMTIVFSVLFAAGLLIMGIRKVAGQSISWKTIFKGFSCAGKIIVATILQTLFVSIGFLSLVLPGIYLIVGYAMTLPLIIDKGLSPWQAMEMSRKAIHKVWWKVTGLFIVMGLILFGSLILLGIGLIWTWPMFIILTGVVYQHLFGDEKRNG